MCGDCFNGGQCAQCRSDSDTVVTTREALGGALRDAVSYMDYDLYKSLETPENGEEGMTFAEVLDRFVKNLEDQ
jgi:hypothetical protein